MNKPVLACRKLTKIFSDASSKIEVLKDINLEVAPGEMIAIVGNSGSGKSTLLHLLGGLDKPTSGDVFLNEHNLQNVTEAEKCRLRNHHLGFIYQFHHLLPEFTALENVGMPLLIKGESSNYISERAAALLQQVGLEHRMQHRLGELSGGERQRVAIARALVAKPACILADEPTGNLDPTNAERVFALFLELQKTHQTSVVMVTHDMNIAKQAKRTMRLEKGSLVEV